MLISIQSHLHYAARQPCDALVQIEAVEEAIQRCRDVQFDVISGAVRSVVAGEGGIGDRRWLHVEEMLECRYEALVEVRRAAVDVAALRAVPVHAVPSAVTPYLMPSRYCHPEMFSEVVPQMFGSLQGGALIAAMSRWIGGHFTYDNGASTGATTAWDSFSARAGVCRDYAHVLITMARAVGIPARFVSAYAPDVTPQDFHAVAEVYLDDAWHLVDPTGMSQAPETVRVGVGRDAADVSFLTSYGWLELKKQAVTVARVE